MLLAYVRDRDVPCPLCKYNLRNLTIPRCPECGQPLTIGVGLKEPFQKAWIALLVATLLPAGPGIVIWFILAFVRESPRFRDAGDLVSFCYLLVSPLLAAGAIAGRRPFLRLSHPV